MKKTIWSITILVSLFITNHPVQAQVTGIKNLVNTNSGLCLAVRGATRNNGEEGTIWTCDGNADKNWNITTATNGYYKIQNMNSNLYLAVGAASRNNGGRVVQYVDQGQQDILWRFIDIGSGIYKIQNKNSSLFLAIGAGLREGGAPLVQWGDEGQQDIKWRLVAVSINNPIVTFFESPNFQGRSVGFNQNTDPATVPFTAQSIRVRTGYIAEITHGCQNEFPVTEGFVGDNNNVNIFQICKVTLLPILGTQTLAIPDFSEKCPNDHYRGDQEFGGNGPNIDVRASIMHSNNQIKLNVSFSAIEAGGDNSSVRGNWSNTVFTAPTGQHPYIVRSSSNGSWATFRSRPAGGEVWPACNEGQVHTSGSDFQLQGLLVRQMIIVGDTGGKDINDNCGCDTKIKRIVFNPITVYRVAN